MKLRLLVFGIIAALALVVACGGNGDDGSRSLELRGFTITESDFRTHIRSEFLNPFTAAGCESLAGLTPADVVDLAALQVDDPRESPPAAAIVMPTQLGNLADRERGAAILLEECERIKAW